MRILIFLRSLDLGGAERQALLLAAHLTQAGHDVQVASFATTGPVGDELRARGLPVIPLPAPEGSAPTRVWKLLRLIARLRRAAPDVIVPFCDYPNKVAGAVWQWTGAAACVWNQRDEGREVTGRPLERRALRRASAFVANSVPGQEFLVARLGVAPERIRLIPNGVDLPPQAAGARSAWRTRLAIPPGAQVAVMVANLTPFKDHLTLLLAWHQLGQSDAAPRILLLAGLPGEAAPSLTDRVREYGLGEEVRFLGQVHDIPGLLAAADLAVYSSRRDGMPNGVLEAMAAGLPVVATDIPGVQAALGPDPRQLVPAGDALAMATGIRRLLADPQLRERLGRQNAARVRSEFSVARMGAAYQALFDELLGEPGA